MRRIVIADAGPLIALAKINQLALLPRLFGNVTITTQIAEELVSGGQFADNELIRAALSEPWLTTIDLALLAPDAWLAQCRDLINLHQIDIGEASAMVLAQFVQAEGNAPLLVIDDFRGRAAAQHSGLALIGTAGLLLLAKQAGVAPLVKPLLLAMRQNGYFLSDRLIEAALRQAGE